MLRYPDLLLRNIVKNTILNDFRDNEIFLLLYVLSLGT